MYFAESRESFVALIGYREEKFRGYRQHNTNPSPQKEPIASLSTSLNSWNVGSVLTSRSAYIFTWRVRLDDADGLEANYGS